MVEINFAVRSKVATGRYKSGVARNIVTIESIKSYCEIKSHNYKKYSEIVSFFSNFNFRSKSQLGIVT